MSDKKSVYDIFKDDISEHDMKILRRAGLINESVDVMKINLLILKQFFVKESKLYDYKGFAQLLMNSKNPIATLDYILNSHDDNDLNNNEREERIEERKEERKEERIEERIEEKRENINHKILTEFVCEIFNPNGCSALGKKISESLIRVAATRIFSEPEQSIMELPVNSVDSYNSLKGRKSVGKFGMGFFSILYWISEPLNSQYFRKLSIYSTYNHNGSLISYVVHLKWSENGLILQKEYLEQSPINDLKNQGRLVTGTKIVLDCNQHNLSNENIQRMKDQLYKLFPIEGATIYLNSVPINRIFDDIVNVYIANNIIIIDDNATGISDETLIKSLLVPSSSTKQRINETEPYREPELVEFQRNELNIIVNGVCINNIRLDYVDHPLNLKHAFNIYMPYNSNLPVSRDNIVYLPDSIEIKVFYKSIKTLINNIAIKTGSLISIFKLLEKYVSINKSEILGKLVLKLRTTIENSNYTLIPNMDFWIRLRTTFPPNIKSKLIIYDNVNIYNTEKKLEEIFASQIRKDIYKLRNVIFGNFSKKISTNGLTTYLFLSNDVNNANDIASLALSNETTFLIPSSDNYDPEFFDGDLNKLSVYKKYKLHPNVMSIAKICLLTYRRKFENFDKLSLFDDYIQRIVLFISPMILDNDFFASFLSSLNSKISNIEINISYGSSPCIYNIPTPVFSHIDNKIEIEKIIHGEQRIDERLVPALKRILMFLVEMTWDKSGSNHVYLPDVCRYNLFFTYQKFSSKNKIKLNQKIKEVLVGINLCVNDSELYIFLAVISHFFFNLNNVGNISGISSYIINEIRRKISSEELLDLIKIYHSNLTNGMYLYSRLLESLILSVEQFYTYQNVARQKIFVEISGVYKFSCKSLIEYVYNNELTESYLSDLNETYKDFDYKKTKLQIVEISVNEGTNKSFITSVLTELVQNSVDAIRSSSNPSVNKDIDITIADNAISVRDYIGFDDIINILIPFLSSKNPNDPNVTGEMGTGFFNVYRRPWTKFVVITSIKNGKKKTVKATPLHENNIVYDIEYFVNIENTNENNMTEISIFLNRDNALLAQTVTDATVFTHSYLSFIRSANVKLNGLSVNTTSEICYPESNITEQKYSEIGQVLIVDNKTVSSYILTNDIPFIPLDDFISYFNSDMLTNLYDRFGRNSIIINLNKNIYKPTQARNKITLTPGYEKLFFEFIYHGIYNAILSLYCKGYYYIENEIISFTGSKCNYKQLMLSRNDDYSPQNTKVPGLIVYLSGVAYQFETITHLINSVISQIPDYKQIEYSTLASKVLYKWFSNKQDKDDDSNVRIVKKRETVRFEKLQIFINIYWRMFHQLIDEKILICNKPTIEPPQIFSEDLRSDLLGYYKQSVHKIFMNMNEYDVEIFNKEISKFKELNSSNVTSFNMNSVLLKYFSPCKPANTLLHEIGHAFTSGEHGNSYHDVTNVRILGSNNLPYDDMCLMIFKQCVERGLMNEYIETLNR